MERREEAADRTPINLSEWAHPWVWTCSEGREETGIGWGRDPGRVSAHPLPTEETENNPVRSVGVLAPGSGRPSHQGKPTGAKLSAPEPSVTIARSSTFPGSHLLSGSDTLSGVVV